MGNVLFWYRNLLDALVNILHRWYKSWSTLFRWYKPTLYSYTSYTSSCSKWSRFWKIVSCLNGWATIICIWILEKSVLSFFRDVLFYWMCTESRIPRFICVTRWSGTYRISWLLSWLFYARNLSLNTLHLLRKNMTLNTTRKICIISSKGCQIAF